MKNTLSWRFHVLTILCFLTSFNVIAQVQTAKYITTNPRSNAYYEYLPQGYNPAGSETYPLILFIHGLGETGAGTSATLPIVLRNGPPKLISQGIFPNSFTVNGITSKFIVISPQFTDWPGSSDINTLLDYLIQNYKIDQSRIYMTGLSMGGGVTWEYAGGTPYWANRLAAIVPVCGASWPDQGRAQIMAGANLQVWATHNNGDPTAPVFYTNDYINYINTAPTPPSPLAKKTIFISNSHDAWSQTYDLNYRENNLNVYEWFLTKQRIITYNPPPIVNAGPDKTITLPTNSVRYEATASDPGGSISIIRWTKVSGPGAGTIDNPTGLWTNMVNLVQGVYVFRLSVTDNGGALTTADVTVTVNGPGTAPLPVDFLKLEVNRKGCSVNVNFSTENEINVDRFEIETSRNGSDFVKVGKLTAGNRGSYVTSFALTPSIKANIIFVRVKSVDRDGSFKYTETKTVNGNCDNGLVFNIYPNPVINKNIVILATSGLFNGKYNVTVMDVIGRIVSKKDIDLDNVTRFNYDAGSITPGKYILKLSGNGNGTAIPFEKF